MCGIFGSTDFKVFRRLYVANQERGTFATSLLFHSPNKSWIKKTPGKLKLTHSLDLLDAEEKYDMFLGHVQAPTSVCRDWDHVTSHPFEVNNWVVAHNGVLENDLELRDKHLIKTSNPVDSYVIPALLDSMYVGDPVRCISETFSEIKGTFGCWIYNKQNKRTYVVRSGSTLHYDANVPTISSIETNDASSTIEEGIIYEMSQHEGLYPVGEFKTNSPFIIL